MAQISIHLFGPARVTAGADGASVALDGSALSVLVYLALHGGRPIPRELLAAELWPDSDTAKSRSRLSTAVWRLRNALRAVGAESQLCVGGGQALGLDAAALEGVDVNRFEALAQAYLDDPERLACPDAARLTGPAEPLAGRYEVWALSARVRLEDLREACLSTLLARQFAAGDDAAAGATAELLLTRDPLREDVYRMLMRIAARHGRPGMVARHYKRCQDALDEELGIAPSDTTRMLLAQLQAPCAGLEQAGPSEPYPDAERAALRDLRQTLLETQRSLARVSTRLETLLSR